MRRIAFETVLRACGFGSLAIFCVMIGLSFEPRVAFQTGGVLTMVMPGILIFKAQEALTKNLPPDRDVALPAQGAAPARGLSPTDHRGRHARDLSHLCAVDVGSRHRHVAARADLFLRGLLTLRKLRRDTKAS